jgi:hypothetical protein
LRVRRHRSCPHRDPRLLPRGTTLARGLVAVAQFRKKADSTIWRPGTCAVTGWSPSLKLAGYGSNDEQGSYVALAAGSCYACSEQKANILAERSDDHIPASLGPTLKYDS